MADLNSNIIMWQKWVDPFGEEDLSDMVSYLNSQDIEPEFYEEEDKDHSNTTAFSDIDKKQLSLDNKQIKVISTPMGIVPVTENTLSGKIFNFWVGHTNFDITKKIADLIEETEGVETLDIFTRYRFRISVGKAFTDSNVMRNINTKVYNYLG